MIYKFRSYIADSAILAGKISVILSAAIVVAAILGSFAIIAAATFALVLVPCLLTAPAIKRYAIDASKRVETRRRAYVEAMERAAKESAH